MNLPKGLAADADRYLVVSRPAERLQEEMHADWRSAVRANWRLLAVVGLVWLTVATAFSLLPIPKWDRGFFVGFMLMGAIGLMAFAIFEASGSRYRYLGQLGERFTADAVSGWRQRRKGCMAVHNLYFAGHGDVDHVLVGSGAVCALESKALSATDSWEVRDGELVGGYSAHAVAQARRGAGKVEAMLTLGRDRLDLHVRPVLVVWGPGAPVIDGGSVDVDGVLVCEGRQQRRWRKELTGALPPEVTDAALAMLVRQRERSEEWSRAHR